MALVSLPASFPLPDAVRANFQLCVEQTNKGDFVAGKETRAIAAPFGVPGSRHHPVGSPRRWPKPIPRRAVRDLGSSLGERTPRSSRREATEHAFPLWPRTGPVAHKPQRALPVSAWGDVYRQAPRSRQGSAASRRSLRVSTASRRGRHSRTGRGLPDVTGGYVTKVVQPSATRTSSWFTARMAMVNCSWFSSTTSPEMTNVSPGHTGFFQRTPTRRTRSGPK